MMLFWSKFLIVISSISSLHLSSRLEFQMRSYLASRSDYVFWFSCCRFSASSRLRLVRSNFYLTCSSPALKVGAMNSFFLIVFPGCLEVLIIWVLLLIFFYLRGWLLVSNVNFYVVLFNVFSSLYSYFKSICFPSYSYFLFNSQSAHVYFLVSLFSLLISYFYVDCFLSLALWL